MSGDSNSFSLINMDGASQVLINLIDKISAATGWVVTHDTPMRHATKTYIEEIESSDFSPIEKAALISRARRDIKEYANQTNIISKAASQIKEDAHPSEIDDEWMNLFMDKAKNISSEELEVIWARILSEETNCPHSIPLKLLEILSYLSVSQAQQFQAICSNVIFYNNALNQPFISIETDRAFYEKQNINYYGLLELDSIGLIRYSERGHCQKNDADQFDFYCNGIHFHVENTPKKELPIGNVLFTTCGSALYSIMDTEQTEGLCSTFTAFLNSKKLVAKVIISEEAE